MVLRHKTSPTKKCRPITNFSATMSFWASQWVRRISLAAHVSLDHFGDAWSFLHHTPQALDPHLPLLLPPPRLGCSPLQPSPLSPSFLLLPFRRRRRSPAPPLQRLQARRRRNGSLRMARHLAVRRRSERSPARRDAAPRVEGGGVLECRLGRPACQVAPSAGLGLASVRRLRLPRAAWRESRGSGFRRESRRRWIEGRGLR